LPNLKNEVTDFSGNERYSTLFVMKNNLNLSNTDVEVEAIGTKDYSKTNKIHSEEVASGFENILEEYESKDLNEEKK
jgi:hypothetical protein